MPNSLSTPKKPRYQQGTREIAATPYKQHPLATLTRRNEWIFSSPTSATAETH